MPDDEGDNCRVARARRLFARLTDRFAAPGRRDLIAQAVEAELARFLDAHADRTDAIGHRRLVRHGHLPERDMQTGRAAGAASQGAGPCA